MKILVVGNAGFIGGYLTKELMDSGYEAVGMDINPPNPKENSCHFVLGNILNPEDIVRAAENVDLIVHLAAKHSDFGISREEFFNVNVKGTQNILDCAAKLGIKKFIFYSTVAVYGSQEGYTTEDTTPYPIVTYGESKLAAEKTIYNWTAEDPGREAIIIRPTVVFGPGKKYGNMYNLIDSIYKKRFVFVGDGENIKSVAYVENLADATVFLLEKLKPGVEIYNYSDYPQMTIAQIVGDIARYLSRGMPKIKIPLKPVMAAARIFDLLGKLTGYNFPITAKRIKKFNTATYHKADKIRASGFQPLIDSSEGFKRTVKWYLNKGM